MSSVESLHLTTYAALELGLPVPVLHALSVYWEWVRASLALYQANPRTFPWKEHQDPGLALYIVRIRGAALKHIRHRSYRLCLAAVTQDGRALKYVNPKDPQQASYRKLCTVAVRQNGLALRYAQHQTLKLCRSALADAHMAALYVQPHILEQLASSPYFNRYVLQVIERARAAQERRHVQQQLQNTLEVLQS